MGTVGKVSHPFILRFTITYGVGGGRGGRGGGREGVRGERGKERERER